MDENIIPTYFFELENGDDNRCHAFTNNINHESQNLEEVSKLKHH